MDKLKLLIINLFVPVSVSVVVFLSIYASGFCSSLALSQGATQSLGSSLGNVFDFSSISASPDPVGMSIGLSQIYDQLDLYLYQNYNYDLSGSVNDTLETGSPYMNITDDIDRNFVTSITNNVYQSMQELTGAGYAFYKCVTNSLSNAKDTFFIGKEENGVITETLDGAITYVDSDTLSMYESAVTNSISNNQILDVTNSKSFYGKIFNLSDGVHTFHLEFDSPVVLYSSLIDNYYYTCIFRPRNITFPFSGFVIDNSTGFKTDFTDNNYINTLETYNTSINGVAYIGRGLYINSLRLDVRTNYILGDRNTVTSFVATHNPYYTDNANVYSLSPDIESLLHQILGELAGHYVSTSDLEAILDSMQNNGYINDHEHVVDGQTEFVPVFDLDSEYLETLQQLVDSILEKSAIYDEVIDDSNSVAPDPDPIYNDQGIAIPPNFNNNIITNVSNIIGLPLQFVSMFSPIFMIFGSNVPLFGLWLFFPIVLIIGVVIWVLK